MKRDEHVDYFIVQDGHLAIHRRLEAWASWVRVRPHGWQVAPMFRQAQSNWRQWHAPELRVQPNIPEAVEMEKAVSLLPDKQRTAVRWAYVLCDNPGRMAQKLGVNRQGLYDLVSQARTMLKNRM
jgi:DNA-directed RNA polymerase specialized sigma24 family protein